MLLGGLMLLAQTAFTLTGRSLEARVERMGAHTLVVTAAVAGEAVHQVSLGKLLAPLLGQAELVSLRQPSVTARDEFGTDCTVMVYGPESRPALAALILPGRNAPCQVLSPVLPAGTPVSVEIAGADYRAVAVGRPRWLDRLANLRPIVLVPEDMGAPWLDYGYLDLTMVVAHPDSPTSAVARLAEGVRTLLLLEQRNTAQVQSPEALLAELDDLRAMQHRWQTGAGLFGGMAVALVFGSIAVLEYRQNRFIVALLRSFGAPSLLLLIRYAVEALLLVGLAVLLVRWGLAGAHHALFSLAGFEQGLLDRRVLNPYTWPEVWRQARWLGLGAAFSVAPIACALRLPVGRVLP
jgi:hypothetical protein